MVREKGRKEGRKERETERELISKLVNGCITVQAQLLCIIVFSSRQSTMFQLLFFLFGRYSQFSQIKKILLGRHILETTYLQKCPYSSKDACTASNIIQATIQKTRTFLSISPQPEQYTKINPLLTAFTSNITGPSNAVYKS